KGESPAIAKKQLEKTIAQLNEFQVAIQNDIKELTARAERPQMLGPELESAVEEVRCFEKVVNELGTKLEHEKLELRAAPRIVAWQDAELMKKDSKKQ